LPCFDGTKKNYFWGKMGFFFSNGKSTDQSRIKSVIVSKYFEAWARVIMGFQDRNPQGLEKKIAYTDLFSGPGKYNDGTESTSLGVLKKALQDDRMRELI
jgi:three-Cys-motif partner protein